MRRDLGPVTEVIAQHGDERREDGEDDAGEHQDELDPHDPRADHGSAVGDEGDRLPDIGEPHDRRDREGDGRELVDPERADAADAVGREPAEHDEEHRDRGHGDREDPCEPGGPHRVEAEHAQREERRDEREEPHADEHDLADRERTDCRTAAEPPPSARDTRRVRPALGSPARVSLSSSCSSATIIPSCASAGARVVRYYLRPTRPP